MTPPRTPPTRAQRWLVRHWAGLRFVWAAYLLGAVGLLVFQIRGEDTPRFGWLTVACLIVITATMPITSRDVRRHVERWDAEHGGPPSEAEPGSG